MDVRIIEKVDEDLLSEMVTRIVRAVDPDKIILFGSHAYGRPHGGSDIDLLVIMKSELPRYKRAVPIYLALAGLIIPKDILVYTPEEVEAWAAVPQAFVTSLIRKGRILYEKK